MALLSTSEEVTTPAEKSIPWPSKLMTNLPRCSTDVCEAGDGSLDDRSISEASEAAYLHGREQHRPVQVETPPKFGQCDTDDVSSWQRPFALMIYGLPYEYRCRDVLNVLASHGIAKEEVSVRLIRRGRSNRGYCHVLFQEEGQALRFADRASGQPFPNSTKRLAIRPTSKQDIWHYVMPARRRSDHVVMALPGKDETFVKIKL